MGPGRWTNTALFTAITLVLCAKAWSCPVAPAHNYYEVEGASVEELEASLRERGPKDDLGKTRFAYTDWTVEWNWKRFDDGTIDPNSIKLNCIAMILLPKLGKASEKISEDLLNAWNGFVKRTKAHELNHVSHIDQTAPRILTRLKEEHKREGAVTRERAEKIISEVIAEIRGLDRRYDARTNHGLSEGTWNIRLE
jgi:predicted secreted Zn-dependent protease